MGKTRTIPAHVHARDIRLTILFSPKAISNEHNPQLGAELLIEDPLPCCWGLWFFISINLLRIEPVGWAHHVFSPN